MVELPEAIQAAIKTDDPEALARALVDASADARRWTAISLAGRGKLWCLLRASELGLSLRETTEDGQTLLHLAVRSGRIELVQALIVRGLEVDARTVSGMTALMMAVAGGRVQQARMLLAAGADPNLRNEAGNTATTIASHRSDQDPGPKRVFERLAADDANLRERNVDPPEASLWAALGCPDGEPAPERVQLRWLTSARAKELSHGEVSFTETVDADTFVPIPGGLFCERIFGRVPRWSDGRADLFAALDQRYMSAPTAEQRASGFVSERTAVGWFGRMGHVDLAEPVPHPWWDPDDSGAPEIARLLVLPPGLRPLFPINADTGDPRVIGEHPRFANSDLNDLYRRLIATNLLVFREQEIAPEVASSRDHLRRDVAALAMNEHVSVPRVQGDRTLRSLALTLGETRDARWRHVLAIEELVRCDPQALDKPMKEPHFSFLAGLRCMRMELVARGGAHGVR